MCTLLSLTFSGLTPATSAFPAETLYSGIWANVDESIPLGAPQIHLGPRNSICDLGSFPKITRAALAARPL